MSVENVVPIYVVDVVIFLRIRYKFDWTDMKSGDHRN